MTDALVDVARAEVASRDKHYPALVASGKMTADEATIDFQAWTLIAAFIETGRFRSIDVGGADGQTVVDWALADGAVERAVALNARQQQEATDDNKRQRLAERGSALAAIARRVGGMRRQVDAINAKFREQRAKAQGERKAA